MPTPRKRKRPVRAASPLRRIAITAPVQLMAADAGQPEGRRRFKVVAYTGEPLKLYAFDLPVVVDCATLDLSAQTLPALLDHMAYADTVVGQIDRVRVAGANATPPVEAEGFFTPTNDPRDAALFVMAKADAGFIWQASIGGDPGKLERVEAGQTVAVNGRTYPGPVYVSRGTVLREISFTVLGADRRTSAVLARRSIKGAAMTFEEWLVSMGFDTESQAALTEIQLANLQRTFNDTYGDEADPAEPVTAADPPAPKPDDPTNPPPPTNAAARPPAIRGGRRPGRPDPVDVMRQRSAAELVRQDAITAIAAQYGNPQIEVEEKGQKKTVGLAAHAIVSKWTRDQTELAALRASRPVGPAVITHGKEKDCTLQALQGAMLLRAGRRLDHPAYQTPSALALRLPDWLRAGLNTEARQRAMEAAHRYSSLSAVDLCREACRLDGQDAPHDRGEMIQAAFSGGSLTNIFTSNVNAILLSTYLEAPDTTVGWVREQDLADFKTQERPRMTKGSNLEKLPRGSEASHYSRSDTAETYRIARYAKQFVVDEQDIIDDSLGALQDMPTEMGMAAARLRPDLVYAILFANAALGADNVALFDHSTHANTDTSAALASATLKAGITAIQIQKEGAVNLNLMVTHLIVPATLRFAARELVNSSQILIARGGTTDTTLERGNLNALQGEGLTIVSDPRLDNGVTDPSTGTVYSGDANDWFLVAALGHTIEVGYLRGTGRAPQVRPFQLDRGKWGIGWDVKMDIGAKALDYRPWYRGQG